MQNRCKLLLQYLLNFVNNVGGNCLLIKYSWWILTICWEIAVVWHVIAIHLLTPFDDSFSIFRDVGKERQRENVSRYKEKCRKDFMRNYLKLFVFKTNLKQRRLISDGSRYKGECQLSWLPPWSSQREFYPLMSIHITIKRLRSYCLLSTKIFEVRFDHRHWNVFTAKLEYPINFLQLGLIKWALLKSNTTTYLGWT